MTHRAALCRMDYWGTKMKSAITQALLTRAMGFAWDIITAGERVVAVAENWELHEGNQERAGFVELTVWRAGHATVRMGERLELRVNALAMRLGYGDGEVSRMVAWPPALAC
jgi:hypothetical protein